MRNLKVLSACTALMLSACALPGIGPFAAEDVNRFIGTKFTNPVDPQRAANRGLYSHVARGESWLYRTEPEGPGTRYYIRYYYERCKYSLYVDENDIIRSWRDEGGASHMTRCLVR
jgi:hypothetical protein